MRNSLKKIAVTVFAIGAPNTVAHGGTVPAPMHSIDIMTQMNLMLWVIAPVVIFFVLAVAFRKFSRKAQTDSDDDGDEESK